MNVTPARLPTIAERHSELTECEEVRHVTPEETSCVQPSLYAQRLERELKTCSCVKAKTRPPSIQSKPKRVFKNTMHMASIVCAALIIPAFTCLFLGPIGLIAPAGLCFLAVACAWLGGLPTEEMARARAERAAVMSEYDPR